MAKKPTRSDASHYIASNNSPIELERLGRRAVMVPKSGSNFEKSLREDGPPNGKIVLRFWGWEKVIAVVDLLKKEGLDK